MMWNVWPPAVPMGAQWGHPRALSGLAHPESRTPLIWWRSRRWLLTLCCRRATRDHERRWMSWPKSASTWHAIAARSWTQWIAAPCEAGVATR
jgi:hypothetical protein